MYLYLGQDTVVNTKDVIGIFDLDNTSASRITKKYLSRAQTEGKIVEVTTDLPKSFVVCKSKGNKNTGEKEIIYLSQISPSTLRKRTDFIKYTANL